MIRCLSSETRPILFVLFISVAWLMVERESYDSTNEIRGKGFLNDASCTEEFRDVEEVLIAGGAGHGNDSSI